MCHADPATGGGIICLSIQNLKRKVLKYNSKIKIVYNRRLSSLKVSDNYELSLVMDNSLIFGNHNL